MFRSQEEAPSSEKETGVLSRYLLLVGTRLRRDGTCSACMRMRKLHHPEAFYPSVFCPYMLVALEVDTVFSTDSSLSFPHGFLSPCAGSGPAMNSGPEAPCVHESSLSHELAVIKAIGKCILCQIHGISVKKKKKKHLSSVMLLLLK